jgi:hypothetical protein
VWSSARWRRFFIFGIMNGLPTGAARLTGTTILRVVVGAIIVAMIPLALPYGRRLPVAVRWFLLAALVGFLGGFMACGGAWGLFS